jgi:hypothetical protein
MEVPAASAASGGRSVRDNLISDCIINLNDQV